MPKSPTYGAILYEQNEICPHDKIAATIQKVNTHSDPIRLQYACQMRKLGDKKYLPDSEHDSSNYLWSVTLRSGTNPYVNNKAKKQQDANVLCNFRNAVFDKMCNGFQRYRCHLTMPKQNTNTRMEWIMKPRDLASISSNESNFKVCSRIKIKKRPASCPAAPSRIEQLDLVGTTTTSRSKLSAPSQFHETLRKSKKNLMNEKRRKLVERMKGGTEQLKVKVLRKSVVVKKQLADSLTREEYMQKLPMEQNEIQEEGKFESVGKRTYNVLHHKSQRNLEPPMMLEPIRTVSPTTAIAGKEVSAPVSAADTSPICLLQDKRFSELMRELNDVPICSNKCRPSATLSSVYSNGMIKSRAVQAAFSFDYRNQVANAENVQFALAAAIKSNNRGNPQSHHTSQHNGRVSKIKTYRLYRILRIRDKRKRVREKRLIKQLYGSKNPRMQNEATVVSSPSINSAKSALLLESNNEMVAKSNDNHDKAQPKQFRRECEIPKSLNLIKNKPLQKPEIIKPWKSEKSEANDIGSEQLDYVISFHTPITLRALIQRGPRAKHSKNQQQSETLSGGR